MQITLKQRILPQKPLIHNPLQIRAREKLFKLLPFPLIVSSYSFFYYFTTIQNSRKNVQLKILLVCLVQT